MTINEMDESTQKAISTIEKLRYGGNIVITQIIKGPLWSKKMRSKQSKKNEIGTRIQARYPKSKMRFWLSPVVKMKFNPAIKRITIHVRNGKIYECYPFV